MANFYAQYASPAQLSIGAQGANGQPAPAVSLEVAGIDPNGDLSPLQTDLSGNLKVDLASTSGLANPLPVTDAAAEASLASIDAKVATEATLLSIDTKVATAANQATEIASLAAIETAVESIDSKTVVVDTANVTIISSVLPTGASTSANQVTELASLAAIEASVNSIDTKTPALGQAAMAASVPVVLASDQSTVPVSLASVPLPAGAATEAKQDDQIALETDIEANTLKIATAVAPINTPSPANTMSIGVVNQSGDLEALPFGQGPMTASLPVVIANDQSPIEVDVTSSVLPTGAATETTLSALNGKFGSLGQKAMAGSAPVVLASDQSAIPTTQSGTWTVQSVDSGYAAVGHAINAYTGSPVTTSAYTQLIASTAAAAKEIEIFDSSGQYLVLALGGSGSEVDQIYIFPGGNGRVKLAIPISTRISIKAVSANATSGVILVNLYG